MRGFERAARGERRPVGRGPGPGSRPRARKQQAMASARPRQRRRRRRRCARRGAGGRRAHPEGQARRERRKAKAGGKGKGSGTETAKGARGRASRRASRRTPHAANRAPAARPATAWAPARAAPPLGQRGDMQTRGHEAEARVANGAGPNRAEVIGGAADRGFAAARVRARVRRLPVGRRGRAGDDRRPRGTALRRAALLRSDPAARRGRRDGK